MVCLVRSTASPLSAPSPMLGTNRCASYIPAKVRANVMSGADAGRVMSAAFEPIRWIPRRPFPARRSLNVGPLTLRISNEPLHYLISWDVAHFNHGSLSGMDCLTYVHCERPTSGKKRGKDGDISTGCCADILHLPPTGNHFYLISSVSCFSF